MNSSISTHYQRKPSSPERFVLPPISSLDEYIPNKNSLLLSPPTPSTLSSSSFPSIYSPPSPPRSSLDIPIYDDDHHHQYHHHHHHQQQQHKLQPINNSNNNNNNNNNIHSITSDVDQVVQQSHGLFENIIHYKPYLISPQHTTELQPWMDEMIGKANQVLNSLLRLRKYQLSQSSSLSSSSLSSSSLSSSSSSSLSSSIPSSSSSSISSPSSSSISPRLSSPLARHSLSSGVKKDTNWQSHTIRQRKRGKRANFQGRCHSCNISETPEWRRGPDGARTLCNACGLHYAKLTRKKAAAAAAAASANTTDSSNETNHQNE
ncbi:unnamed protein product [Cunninghamella echinulata]